jgi:hypothetical protein
MYENATAKYELNAAMRKLKSNIAKQHSVVVGESGGLLKYDDNSTLFDLVNYTSADGLDESQLEELQRRMYKLYVEHPLAHGWIDVFVRFIVGDEFQLKSLDHDPRTQEVWDKFAENVAGPEASAPYPFEIFAVDVVRQSLIMGEDFQREYVYPSNGQLAYRKMSPLYVRSPGYRAPAIQSFGVETAPGDSMRVLRYWYDANRNGMMTPIPAEQVIHTKMGQPDMKRGRPLLMAAMKYLIELEMILQARRKLHQVRCSCAIEEYVEGGPDMVDAWIEANKVGGTGADRDKIKAPEIGSIEVLGGGRKREFKTPNMQAQDGDADIRRVLLCIGTALGVPEYIVATDASNNDYASIRETTYPGIRTFEGYQRFFGMGTFERMGTRVVESAIRSGRLDPMSYKETVKVNNGVISRSRELVKRNTKFLALYPSLMPQNVKETTESLVIHAERGWVSDRTAQVRLGYNSDEERQQIEVEKTIKAEDEASAQQEMMAMMKAANRNGNQNGTNGKPQAPQSMRLR